MYVCVLWNQTNEEREFKLCVCRYSWTSDCDVHRNLYCRVGGIEIRLFQIRFRVTFRVLISVRRVTQPVCRRKYSEQFSHVVHGVLHTLVLFWLDFFVTTRGLGGLVSSWFFSNTSFPKSASEALAYKLSCSMVTSACDFCFCDVVCTSGMGSLGVNSSNRKRWRACVLSLVTLRTKFLLFDKAVTTI